jgi:hypothetical protein
MVCPINAMDVRHGATYSRLALFQSLASEGNKEEHKYP